MKKVKPIRLLSLLLAGSFGLMQAPSVFAAAGDTIGNTATLNYDVGGVAQTLIESAPGAGNSTPGATNGTSTDFLEDRLINFTVTRGGATSLVTPSATLQAVDYTVDNTGNDTQDFLLLGLNRVTGTADPFGGNADSFDTTAVQVFVESGATAGFQPAQDTAIYIDELAPAAAPVVVYVVSTIPSSATVSNGDVAVMSLVVQAAEGGTAATEGAAINNDDNGNVSPAGVYSNGGTAVVAGTANDVADDPAAMEDVFNDPAGTLNSAGAAGATQIGQTSDDSSYTVSAADLTVAKTSVTLYDPVNGNSNPKSIPGGYIQYTITVSNAAGAATAELTDISDALAAAIALDPDLLLNDGATPENAAGDGFRVDTTGTSRPSAGLTYCTGDVGDADTDGCAYTGGAGGTVQIDFTALAGMGVEAGYTTAGELQAGESISIVFNVIVQ